MNIGIITLAFDPLQQGFDNEELQQFLAGKTVLEIKPEFFTQNGHAYWTVLVEYEAISTPVEQKKTNVVLNSLQQQLYDMLKQWRSDKAKQQTLPVYIIATNKEMAEIAKKQPKSLEALQTIAGFGKKKAQNHGDDIITIVKRFAGLKQKESHIDEELK